MVYEVHKKGGFDPELHYFLGVWYEAPDYCK